MKFTNIYVRERLARLKEMLRQRPMNRHEAAAALEITHPRAALYLQHLYTKKLAHVALWTLQENGMRLPSYSLGAGTDAPKPQTQIEHRLSGQNAADDDKDDEPFRRQPQPEFVPRADFAASWIKRRTT